MLCPICRREYTNNLNEIPRSLVTLQLIEFNLSKPVSKITNTSVRPVPVSTRPTVSQQPPPLPPYPENLQYRVGNIVPAYANNLVQYTSSPVKSEPANKTWNLKDYLKKIFDEIDINHDGGISSNELQKILRNIQSSAEFSAKTVDLVIRKYDKNRDGQISFEEFFDLYNNLNEELEAFLLIDSDGNGYIDCTELEISFRNKGHQLSRAFYEYIYREICKYTAQKGILFDSYIRVASRFDYLCKQFYNTPYYFKNFSFETYLAKTFFQDFW